MLCPKCGGEVLTIDFVNNTETNEKYRERKCVGCGNRFHTIEFEVEETQQFSEEWAECKANLRERIKKSMYAEILEPVTPLDVTVNSEEK